MAGQHYKTRYFHADTGTHRPGMTLPRTTWVRLNRLRIGVGRFCSCLHKCGMASCGACECGAEEHTIDHAVLQCPINRPPHGFYSLAVLNDETVEWLPTPALKSSAAKQLTVTTRRNDDDER